MLNIGSGGAKKGLGLVWELARKGGAVKVYLVMSYFRSNGCAADTGAPRFAVSYKGNKGIHKMALSYTELSRYFSVEINR